MITFGFLFTVTRTLPEPLTSLSARPGLAESSREAIHLVLIWLLSCKCRARQAVSIESRAEAELNRQSLLVDDLGDQAEEEDLERHEEEDERESPEVIVQHDVAHAAGSRGQPDDKAQGQEEA